jgi:hypothetical protein
VNFIKTANNTEALLVASKDIGLEVNAEKSKYVFMSCEQNSGQNHNIMTGSKSFASEAKFKHLETTLIHSCIHSFCSLSCDRSMASFKATALTIQNCIHEEIKNRLSSGNACYHSIKNILSSSLLSKKVQRLKCTELLSDLLFYMSVIFGLSH